MPPVEDQGIPASGIDGVVVPDGPVNLNQRRVGWWRRGTKAATRCVDGQEHVAIAGLAEAWAREEAEPRRGKGDVDVSSSGTGGVDQHGSFGDGRAAVCGA